MKILVATTAVALIAMGSGLAADGKYLNVAILTLPAQYLADIPLDQRDDLLISLSSSLFEDSRLDYEHGWLHYFSDNPRRGLAASSMFWVKVLPRGRGKTPGGVGAHGKAFRGWE